MINKKMNFAISLMLSASVLLTACSGKDVQSSNNETSASVSSVETSVSSVSEENTESAETSTSEASVEEAKTETAAEDLILKDCVEKNLGCFVGCAATENELADPKVWDIITKHFNAITFGNELKPDALFNYSLSKPAGTQTVSFNGEDLLVPRMDYSRAERMLKKIKKWNDENPDNIIKVRGHVLVWHSQTPEWFFHEDYDKSKPYVDKDTMNKRLEWYICTVLTHFTGEDSEWKGMFYGWDVVNEAISDGTCSYRSDNENPNEKLSEDRHGSNSSWWHVYESNEFIINAFKYANKYAPADLELYYNDYNDSNLDKTQGIVKLLQAIKDEEGEPGVGTRISAMGMQGHYGMENPSYNNIEAAIKSYCKVVGHVQMTEVDISASSDYTGDASQKEEENEKLKKRYNMINFAITAAMKKEGVNFDGITFWGTVDHYSWLQSRSNVGGGNTTGLPQMPLLFDENYEPKPCFYVFAK
ncbi:MAG: endo-1,4-beta-xylanase [Lachnospiraceae bacterium]|nr:endo-1,4-beta-xylanase [Lachnospiraceae bacterium]